ncbi:hypothetical protein [Aurantimicrobium sp. MWH-Uga1]|uniref:hypothetical protein n=1 Tax=Aurantimicrobium sp. MWH-Uga1 TaxID=2079575 RepID=UPI000DEDFF8E|nr:hypothetical protein [Aurantimicrobium sp. MWH-Uga1]AXE53855.1 hypothetical protein AURUGA1_00143 [Aurantimicrobium sp. MWH-Uga1]
MPKIFRLLLATSLSFCMVFFALPAHATTPDPTMQGGTEGVLFVTEMTDGAIYIGDFKSTPTPKSIFWQDTASSVNQVAVTSGYVAWASNGGGSNIRGKVLISPIATTAGTITTVSLPLTGSTVPVIHALAADYFGERFYAAASDNKIYSFKSDGTDLRIELSHSSVMKIRWGMWVDSYNNTLTYCTFSNYVNGADTPGDLFQFTITGSTVSAPVTLKANFLQDCDGVGVDPVDGKVFAASSAAPWASFATYLPSDPSSFATIAYNPVLTSTAPSSMFVSHSTGKFYFTTEQYVHEANFDGTQVRTLYVGTHTGAGFQNLAVYYGATIANINSTAAAARGDVPQSSSGTSSISTSSSPSLAATGDRTGTAPYFFAGAAILFGLGMLLLRNTIIRKRR